MSSEPLPLEDVEDVTKGQLVEVVRGQQAHIEKMEEQMDEMQALLHQQVNQNQLNILLSALTGAEFDDYAADPVTHKDAVEDLHTRISGVENTITRLRTLEDQLGKGSASGVDEAWLNIVEAAKNLKNEPANQLPNNRVQLFKEEIVQATGKSKDQAGNYIEWFGKDGGKHEKPGTEYQPYQPPSAINNNEARKKRIIVDLDVWGDNDE